MQRKQHSYSLIKIHRDSPIVYLIISRNYWSPSTWHLLLILRNSHQILSPMNFGFFLLAACHSHWIILPRTFLNLIKKNINLPIINYNIVVSWITCWIDILDFKCVVCSWNYLFLNWNYWTKGVPICSRVIFGLDSLISNTDDITIRVLKFSWIFCSPTSWYIAPIWI